MDDVVIDCCEVLIDFSLVLFVDISEYLLLVGCYFFFLFVWFILKLDENEYYFEYEDIYWDYYEYDRDFLL